jgi:hypothetical protein
MCDKDEIHSQIVETLENTAFPKNSHEELIKSLPEGINTFYRAENIVMTAGAADKFIKETDFPFKSAEEVADIIVDRCVFYLNNK